MRIHGCTVHFVTAELDHGPVVIQAAVPVLADDDEDRLAARVLQEEHRIYPQVALVRRRSPASGLTAGFRSAGRRQISHA